MNSIFPRITAIIVLPLVSAILTANAGAAELKLSLYGEINVSRDFIQNKPDLWVSNVSKIGVKGGYEISDSLEVIYQAEQEVDLIRGGTDIDTLFSTRNTFIGLKGDFGKIFFGAHDTPLKRTQGKIDLFNDQLGDIKALLPGEVRARDTFSYLTPVFADGFSIQTMYVPGDGDFGASKSIAATYDAGDLYVSLAIDDDMRKNERAVSKTKVYDSIRGALQYTPGDWALGFIVQSSRQVNTAAASRETGYVVSASRKVGDFLLKGQYGQSDILTRDSSQLLLGADYVFSKSTKVYLIASRLETGAVKENAVSVGAEFKF